MREALGAARGGRTRTAAALLAAAVLSACVPRPAAMPVRIVLITLDALRFDRFEERSGEAATMPRTRAFAERGLRFASCWSASSATQPTHASLFTGLHPWQHGVTHNGATLVDVHKTLAERLKARGFATAGVIASFPLEPRFGFAQGFDTYRHDFEQVLMPAWEGAPVADDRFYSLAEAVTRQALEALDAATAERQFFFFHYFDAHDPYGDSDAHPIDLTRLVGLQGADPAGFEAALAQSRRLYDHDVEALDRALGVLLDRLVSDSTRFETHVLITADHGESFGELDALGHGRRVTREQVHVPLVIVSPRVAPGIRRDSAGTVDLTATVLALAGVTDVFLPGRDLTRTVSPTAGGAVGMTGQPAEPLDPARAGALSERFFAVRAGALYSGDAGATFEDDDPARRVPDATLAAALRGLFQGFEASLRGHVVRERLDPETERGLRALGYGK